MKTQWFIASNEKYKPENRDLNIYSGVPISKNAVIYSGGGYLKKTTVFRMYIMGSKYYGQ